MRKAHRARTLRRALIVGNLSYKLRSHLELAVVALVIAIVMAAALPWVLHNAILTPISEVYTITRLKRIDTLSFHAETGRWPAPVESQAAQELRANDDAPVGQYFHALQPAPAGAVRAVPNERLARAARLSEQSYWLTPTHTTESAASPFVFTCIPSTAAPQADDVVQRRRLAPHLPLSFCL